MTLSTILIILFFVLYGARGYIWNKMWKENEARKKERDNEL